MWPQKHSDSTKPRLSDLNGLRVCIVLPPSAETQILVSHLQRIGCVPVMGWPIPEQLPSDIDVAIVTVEAEYRANLNVLSNSLTDMSAPLIALVQYEDPSTLQLVFEMRAAAVIERPIKPFGLLTNLMIARSNWQLRADTYQQLDHVENKQIGLSKIAIAKILLRQQMNVSDKQAHRMMQKRAMDTRTSLEIIAEQVMAERAPDGLQNILDQMQEPDTEPQE